MPASVRYFHPSGFFALAGASYVYQNVDRSATSTLKEGDDSVVLLDAAVGLRLPGRYGIVSLEGRNLLDSKFDHQDLNFITNERRASSLLPERAILGRLTLSF